MLLTSRHRMKNAIRFKLEHSGAIWLVIGGQAAWPIEYTPPTPALSVSAINTPVGAKLSTIRWVIQDVAGTIPFVTPTGIQMWRELTTPAEVISNQCRWCMVQGTIVGTELPTTTFRELGFFNGLVPTAGNEGSDHLLPSEVLDYGAVETIEYRAPVTRDANSSFTFTNIVEF